jgi:DNA (cytosine-5)-methyltransferase 1
MSCQDVSSAGTREGLAGIRSGLWFEFLRIVGELLPSWVVVENVASGARAWCDTVCRGLGQFGFQTLPVPVSASDCGAPHRRKRIFVIARNGNGNGKSIVPEHVEMARVSSASSDDDLSRGRLQSGRRIWPSGSEASDIDDVGSWGGRTAPEPSICRMDDGVPRELGSTRQLRTLGNAVVPQCAEVVGWMIRELIDEQVRGVA